LTLRDNRAKISLSLSGDETGATQDRPTEWVRSPKGTFGRVLRKRKLLGFATFQDLLGKLQIIQTNPRGNL